ncbi:hypothetical protein AURDEDRAFT_113655 [Auricularia subglabra TFB-10046 SS5]|nr:hypothetical protein AURDEDRAFT_113655 [Auricularia subglabra TFB-10046 SS5]
MFLGIAGFIALAFVRVTVGAPTEDHSVVFARSRGAVEFNERTLSRPRNITESPFLSRRAEDTAWSATHPGLKAAIDGAVRKTAAKPHYFWSGRILPATSNADGVMSHAIQIAKARGGTTLELTMEGVPMPEYGGDDPDTEEIWQYSSDEYAHSAKGDVFFVKGESLRAGNVWEVYEYPRLKKSAVVKRIFQITIHRGSVELPRQIWPQLKGCDGVFFIDKTVTCPSGSRLYHGSAKKPVVTAKTTVANDATVKIAATGKAPGIIPTCTEILSGDWITKLFTDSGVCDAAAAKGNGGKAMNQVKQLLESGKNRQYIQQNRLIKSAARVIGNPSVPALLWSLLDSLVAISYYEKTAANTAALTKQIDNIVRTATGKSPGVAAAWAKEIAGMKPAKAALLAELRKQIAQKQKQANENKKRADACGKPPAAPGGAAPKPGAPSAPKPAPAPPASPKPARRGLSEVSPAPLSSLQRRVAKAPRSGAKAPKAPSCPLPNQNKKKVVPRDKVRQKAPAKKPRVAQRTPKPKSPAAKKTAKRPASRPRRQPGKAAPKKRVTPKKQPRKVPRPARKPKGKARPRRGRR